LPKYDQNVKSVSYNVIENNLEITA
jgi:hypothetical protein